MTSIRPLDPDDFEQVLSLNAGAQPNVFLLDRAELARLQLLSRSHIVVAQSQVVLGYALAFSRADAYDGEEFLVLRSLISEPFVYVDQVVVQGSLKGTGIGRRLYEALAQVGSSRGACSLCCEVNTEPPNPSSLAFHRHMGFSAVGSLATKDGRNVELLQKHLRAAA